MGRKCCVPKCRSGYSLTKSNTNDAKQTISVFSFPENQELRRKWMRAIPRDNWESTSNSGVCKQHFKPDDLALERTDTNERRTEKKEPLALLRLKSNVIPTIFPNCPAYLSKEIPNRRSGGATSENRLENYEQRVTHVFNFHEKVFGDTEFRKLLLNFPSPRVVFIASLKMLVEERKWLVQALFGSQCGSGHKFRDMFSVLAKCVFNICSKNFCSETNSTIHKSKKGKNLPSSKQSRYFSF